MATRKVVFVAYSSKDTALSNGVFDAISKANARPLPIIYEPWVFNDVAGGPLISPILAKIDDSPFVIADITYLNLNVVYEIGFAIGRNKRAFLVRHKGTQGDQQLTKAVGIFDTLGYHEYETFDELKDRLSAHIEPTHLHFSNDLDAKFSVYIVEPSFRDESITTAISRIKKAR
jgi:acyl-CoA-binding protein